MEPEEQQPFSFQLSQNSSSTVPPMTRKLNLIHYTLILLCLAIAAGAWAAVIYAFVT